MHHEQQGIRLWVEPDERLASGAIESSSDLNLTVGVEPADASNRVQVRYRVNGGPVAAIAAQPVRHVGNAQYFKAQLPCAALRDGDTVEYGAVCQCAGRQVPSAVEAEQFAASFRVISPSAPGSPTAAVGSAMRMELAPAMASRLAPDSWSQTLPTYTKRPNATHLSLFVLEQNTGHPIARMPFFAEVGVFLPPPKYECKLGNVILSVLQEFFTPFQSVELFPQSGEIPHPESNVETLVELLCEPLSRLLAPEVIDHMVSDSTYAAPIIRAILQKIKALATSHPANDLEALRKLLEEAILAYAKEQDLPLAESDNQTQRIVWAHPLGVLATDHAGYLSFDLTRLPTNVADALALALEARRRDPNTATDTSIWLYPMAREANKIDALAQGRFTHDAIVVKVELKRPVLPSTVENLGILAMQNPNLTDWRLSPGSFATNPGALVGDDGCETLLPANVALQEFYFYQVVGLTDAQDAVPVGVRDRIKLGVIHEYRLAWYPLGHSLGQILYSLPLAPGESVNLAVIDWTRRDDAQRKEHTTVDEQLVHDERRDRTISETVDAAVHEYQHGSSFMAGLSGAYGGSSNGMAAGIAGSLGGSTSNSSGSRDVAATTVQKLSDNITQASSAQRELQSTVVVHSTQAEKEAIETRTVVNYNHSHALTILYYEVLRHFRVATELVRRRPAVLTNVHGSIAYLDPGPPSRYVIWWPAIYENRKVLEAAVLDDRYKEGFEIAERRRHREIVAGGVVPPPPPPCTPTPPLPVGPQLRFFVFDMFSGGWNSEDDAREVTIEAYLQPKNIRLVGHMPGDDAFRLNPLGTFRIPNQNNSFVGMVPNGGTVYWGEIDLIQIWVHLNLMSISFQHITVTAIDINGNPLRLIDKGYESGHLTLDNDWNIDLPTLRPQPGPPPPGRPAAEIAAEIEEEAKFREFNEHLLNNRAHYDRALWLGSTRERRVSELASLQVGGGATLLEKVENRPIEVLGDYVAYPCTDEAWKGTIESLINPPLALSAYQTPPVADELDERLVTLPTRGVFAEAKLGHCNASEEIDNTRFWDWQTSPIPHFAPEIAPTVPVTPQPQQQNLSPTPFPSPIVNIVNPPNAPDPTGLAAAMNVLATPNIFRDMSGRAEVADLLKKLSDNSVSIAQAANEARRIQSNYGSNLQGLGGGGGGLGSGSGGGRSAPAGAPQTVGEVNELASGIRKQLPPAEANALVGELYKNVVGKTSGELQQVGDKYVRPAYTPNELAAIVGEGYAVDALKAEGHIVFTDWRKHVSARGFDMVTYNPADKSLWIVDNKAQFSGIGKANALTGAAFDSYKAELRQFLETTWSNKAEAKLALDVLDAAKTDASRIKLVVTNGWAGDATRFTKGLFDKGLHAFDVRLGKLFYPTGTPVTPATPGHAEWEAGYKSLTFKKGARVTGKRGVTSVGPMLLAMATIGGAVFLLKAGSEIKKIAGEIAANLALDTVLSWLPSGWIASFTIGLESCNEHAIEMGKKVDELLAILPGDVSSLPPAELKATRDALQDMIENPIIIPEPPDEPLQNWPTSPSSEGSAGGV